MQIHIKTTLFYSFIFLLFNASAFGHPIDDYFKAHKKDRNMEARIVPPKMASLLIDEDYPEAIDLLRSLSALKYLNFYGEKDAVLKYAKSAARAKGQYQELLTEKYKGKNITVFGNRKNGLIRKLMVIVESKSQFLLLIGKGKLTQKQLGALPVLSEEL